jgi:AcrR family transcriptional regulator
MTVPDMTDAVTHWTKLSAEGKRERLLSAADSVFVESGLDAPMPLIAERAGASIGSVYRQFPSKVDLIEAVIVRRFALIERVAAEATMSDDPAWPELVGMVFTLVARQVAAGFFAEAWDQVADRKDPTDARSRAHAEFCRVIDRCRAHECLRPDATADDLWLIFAAARGTSRYDSVSWRRTVTLMLEGLRAV